MSCRTANFDLCLDTRPTWQIDILDTSGDAPTDWAGYTGHGGLLQGTREVRALTVSFPASSPSWPDAEGGILRLAAAGLDTLAPGSYGWEVWVVGPDGVEWCWGRGTAVQEAHRVTHP